MNFKFSRLCFKSTLYLYIIGSENFPSAEQETPAQNILDNFVLDKPEEALAKKSFTVSEHAVLVLDGSLQNPRSLDGSCIFEEIKRAMSQMMKSCRVGMVHRCSYAAVTYSCSSKVEFDFLSDALAIKKLKSVPYPGGSCRRTDKGLETAANLFKGLYFSIHPFICNKHFNQKVAIIL